MITEHHNGHEITGDSHTVWINGPHGTCCARFGRGGADIRQLTYPPTVPFLTWVQDVKFVLGVDVPWSFKPAWAQ